MVDSALDFDLKFRLSVFVFDLILYLFPTFTTLYVWGILNCTVWKINPLNPFVSGGRFNKMAQEYESILLKMKQKSDEFKTYLTELNNLNNDVSDKTGKLKTIITFKGAGKDKLCSVCYSRPSTHAFLNCGHTHCENCAQRGLNRNRCFRCRSEVEGIMKIFM